MKLLTPIFIGLLLLTSPAAFAQFDLGLKFMPNMSFNRVQDIEDDNDLVADNSGIGIRYGIGAVADIRFGENYALSTGLNFVVKRAGVNYDYQPGNTNATEPYEPFSNGELVHNLQYVQIPLGIKLYTNEIMTDIQLYFNVAGTIDIKVAENMIKSPSAAYEDAYGEHNHYRPLDFGGILAVGGEMALGSNTKVFGGLYYNRNFLNIMRDELDVDNNDQNLSKITGRRENQTLSLSQLGLEVGLKF